MPKYERQAQTVGVIALMPSPLIQGMSVEEMMREFEVSMRVAVFRLEIGV